MLMPYLKRMDRLLIITRGTECTPPEYIKPASIGCANGLLPFLLWLLGPVKLHLDTGMLVLHVILETIE